MDDFLIIGGGIAGISAAARLSELGSVTLLEAEEALGFHASGRTAGMFLINYGNHIVRALNRASATHHHNDNGGVLTARGLMMLGRSSERSAFEAEAAAFEMTEISVENAAERVQIINPKSVAYVGYVENAPDLDTDLKLQNYLKEARGAGAKIVTAAKATAISRQRSNWTVSTPTDDYHAHTLVNAGGAWVDEIAQMAGVAPIGFQPYRRSMARMPAPGGHDVSRWPMIEAVAGRWYAKPDAGKWLVSPCEFDPVDPHDAWADDMVLAEGIERYSQMVTEEVTRVETSWAGLRTFAPDKSLVIGYDPVVADFLWIAGQGGYGFQTAPAASTLLAELVGGGQTTLDSDVVAALDPGRFK